MSARALAGLAAAAALLATGCGDRGPHTAADGCKGVDRSAKKQPDAVVLGAAAESRRQVCQLLGPPDAIARRGEKVVWTYDSRLASPVRVVFDRRGRGRGRMAG